MTSRICSLVVVACIVAVAAAESFAAWDLENGDFAEGSNYWNTALGMPGASVEDLNADGRNELVLGSANLVNQYDGVLVVQDVSPRYMDLYNFGVALRADFAASNLSAGAGGDLRAFTKLEFLDAQSNAFNTATLSGEYDGALYATGDVSRPHVTLVANANTLVSKLALLGRTVYDVKKIRAGCFLFRFDDTHAGATGTAAFENVALGRVSELDYGRRSLVNADFEFGNWAWMDNPRSSVSSTSGWSVVDMDGDGDLEACFSSADLNGQYAGRLWVQDFYTYLPPLAWTSGISLTADIVASNLTPGLRAFHKLEFGGPYFSAPAFPGVFVSSEDPAVAATGSISRLQSTITMPYDTLTNQLHAAGRTISDVVYVRAVIFLMQFDESAPAPGGCAYFDNLRLDFQYADSPLNPDVNYSSRIAGDQIELSWGNLTTATTYHVQCSDGLNRRWSNVVENLFSFDYDTLTVTTALHGAAGCYRVVQGPYMADPE